ncbi:hypothetical protein O181_061344 [Austropuccinia psidii MF-1]|uniref:Integrase catalytic domain-containing protein n=1 Tax=Austropuccinia psidii MF-1 TaxID=1389203 RepID=A0A9Q3EI64_9BASI|nr:hypothetical protein [Austropuccinia psidii MF-1]
MRIEFSIPEIQSTAAPLNLCHQRMGHPGNLAIKEMGLPPANTAFSTCNLNKMHILLLKDHFGDVSQPLDCVHLDLVSPISPASMSGFHYFLTIVDQATSFKIVRLLKIKSDAFDHHILSPPKTPQNNEFAERANQTIIEKARCILNRSNLPKGYWAEAVNPATFLSNLIPTPSRSNHSPYVIWKENIFPHIQAASPTDEAWVVPWDSPLESTEMVDKYYQSDHSLVDKVQLNNLCSLEDSSRLVDEAQEFSSDAAAVEDSRPVNLSHIEVIGPRHPTLIVRSVDSENILPNHQQPKTLFTALVKSPRTYKQAINCHKKVMAIGY